MAKQEVKKIGEHAHYQLALDRVSQVAAILTAVSSVDYCMGITEICQSLDGCNALLGDAVESMFLLNELEVINA